MGQSGHRAVREVEHGRSEEEEGSEEEVARGKERGADEAEEEREERKLVRRQAQPGEAVQKRFYVLPDSGPKCRYIRVRPPCDPVAKAVLIFSAPGRIKTGVTPDRVPFYPSGAHA